MNVSIILAHPNPESFNHAIAQAAASQLQKNGYSVIFHDLYAERFDPILPAEEIPTQVAVPEQLKAHCMEISSADGIVIVHPNWWGQPPAILKGWVDRVLRPGVAYKFLEGDKGEGIPIGLLKARTAIVFNTANTGSRRERDMFGDPLQLIWKNCIFDLCGVRTFHREMFTIMITSTMEQRKGWLNRVDSVLDEHFPCR
ncbi:MAG: NAD(P)H-dependent oxidoreductase [Desulfomonile tiedjei]|uniref:NAD(P)H-dependent oxidoreductase n=1 Tax=Desulfomonile tiedjei TaxID=2358 RepID=A0A9D6V724_9BACT|nr:NAD(P)H-dependent oxidoreductase [Desulfomonile tiedjei]